MGKETLVLGGENVQREEMDGPLAIDFHQNSTHGNILKIGSSIFFLKYWDDDVLMNAYSVIQEALLTEGKERGWEIKED